MPDRIEVIYHPQFPGDPLNAPTIGLKVTTGDKQYGMFRELDENHSLGDALWDLVVLTTELYNDLGKHPLSEGTPPGP